MKNDILSLPTRARSSGVSKVDVPSNNFFVNLIFFAFNVAVNLFPLLYLHSVFTDENRGIMAMRVN